MRGENRALTGIRGIAAVWVMLFHYAASASGLFGTSPPPEVLASGFLGVDLFFVLSGFVLGLSYSDALAAETPRKLTRFFVGRAFRILPLHWFVLCVFGLMVLAFPSLFAAPDRSPVNFATSFFLVHLWVGVPMAWNWPTWSLSAEFAAYLLFPVIVVVAARAKLRPATKVLLGFGSITLYLAILLALGRDTVGTTGYLSLARCVLQFLAGYLLSRVSIRGLDKRAIDGLLIAGLALVICAANWPQTQFAALYGFAMIVMACGASSRLGNLAFANPVSYFLGKISYSIYLVHALLLVIFEAAIRQLQLGAAPPIERAALGAGYAFTTLVSAYLAWTFIEVPGQRIGRRLLARIVPTGPATVSPTASA